MSKKLPNNFCKFTGPCPARAILVILPENRQFLKILNFVTLMILTNFNYTLIV